MTLQLTVRSFKLSDSKFKPLITEVQWKGPANISDVVENVLEIILLVILDWNIKPIEGRVHRVGWGVRMEYPRGWGSLDLCQQ